MSRQRTSPPSETKPRTTELLLMSQFIQLRSLSGWAPSPERAEALALVVAGVVTAASGVGAVGLVAEAVDGLAELFGAEVDGVQVEPPPSGLGVMA